MSLFDTEARPSWPPFDGECLPETPDARVRLAALSTIAAILVHELSQPISAASNSLRSHARQLRTQQDNGDDPVPIVEEACREMQKAGDVLRRMRSFITSGRIASRRESLAAIIETLGPAQACPDGLKVEIVKSIPQSADHVLVDRILIEQVLSKIFANACEALVGSSIRRITLGASRMGDQIVVRIQDSGPCLSDYQFIHLFEPLFTAKTAGAGMGLPVCKTIVEAQGGRLWAERPNDGGAVFGMSLPAAD
jgi:two-component system sensor kinase FixL